MEIAIKIKKTFICFSAFYLILSFSGCQKNDTTPTKTEEFMMNTIITQTVYGEGRETAAKNVNNILKELENKFSTYIDTSDVSKINKNAGLSSVKVDEYTFELIRTAVDYSKKSMGLFDLTVAPLTKLWAIETSSPHIPTQLELDTVLSLINYENVIFDESKKSIFLKEKGMAIDLGGIAKGYFIGKIEEEYKNQNIKSAICSIGGNIFTYGTKPENTDFILGIRDPQEESSGSYMGTLKSSDETVATTGKYERYFEHNGIKYHHVLDLNTGFPSETDLLSVTVISKNGGLADFLSTTLFLAGSSEIEKYLNDTRFSVIVINDKNQVFCSDAIKDKFTITNNKYVLIED